MLILIVVATESEIAPFASMLEKFNPVTPYTIEILVTGVGVPASILSLAVLLSKRRFDLILNVGVAGAIDESFRIPSLLWIHQDEFYDWGVEDQNSFISVFELGLVSKHDNPFHAGRLKSAVIPDFAKDAKISSSNAITVMRVHGKHESISELKNRCPHAQVESMEGAAVFYTAAHFEIPCIQLRAISNRVEPRNRAAWKLSEAIDLLNNQLMQWFITP